MSEYVGIGANADKKVRVNHIDPPKELNIAGAGVFVVDNPGAGTYDITIPAPPGGGETNTASNAGAGGVGVTLPKVIADLPFKSINAGSSKVTVTDDVPNKEVDIDVAEANLTLSNMGGAVTKIQTPATTVFTDQVNSFGHFDQTFHGAVIEETYQDIKTVPTPANPPAHYIRLYAKEIDPNNYGLFIITYESGAFQEVRVM